MEKVQSKLKDCIEKQSLKSLDRLADALETGETVDAAMEEDDTRAIDIDASETMNVKEMVVASPGENKVMVSKRSKRKQKHIYRMKPIERKNNHKESPKPKRKFRYHCAF